MAQRIEAARPGLPLPVVSKMLAQDAGELDFRLGHPDALGGQARTCTCTLAAWVGPTDMRACALALVAHGTFCWAWLVHALCGRHACVRWTPPQSCACPGAAAGAPRILPYQRLLCPVGPPSMGQVEELLAVYESGGAPALEAHAPERLQWERVRQLAGPGTVGLPIGYQPAPLAAAAPQVAPRLLAPGAE